MAYRLRQIEFTADGRRIVRDRDIARDAIAIGRDAGNDIHLPDLALDPLHARITRRDEHHIAVTAAGTLGFTLDGASLSSATIDTRSGGELGFASYRIAVGQDADGTTLLTIQRQGQSAGAIEGVDEKRSFTLAGVMPSRRVIAWVSALLILALFLALPIASHLLRTPGPQGRVIGDASWNPGPLSLAHHGLKDHCEACHVKAFVAVRDETCRACHKDAHDHAPPSRLAMARLVPFMGGHLPNWLVHGFSKSGTGACADCHIEHQGQKAMSRPDAGPGTCVNCHGDLKARLGDTRLGDASDFGTRHPQFSPLIVTNPDTLGLSRVSLDAHPRESSGLAFSHQLHLDPLGGVARMAGTIGALKDYGSRGLACKDCHHRSEDGVSFQPITMQRDCEACHSLAYDRVGGTVRQLHHGDVGQMVADLSAGDLHHPVVSGAVVSGRNRPGAFGVGGVYYSDFGSRSGGGGSLAQRALSKGGICGECHTPRMVNGRLGVVPVTLVSHYLPDGLFDHYAHRQTRCEECHAAQHSTSSADILLPRIQQCRSCHLGESEHKAKVPSGCVLCHAYHPSPLVRGRAGWDAGMGAR